MTTPNPTSVLWTQEDAVARRCRFIDVGTPRIEEAPPAPLAGSPPASDIQDLPEVTDLPAKVLKRDLMRAYQRLGGVDWLVGLPRGDFVKLLGRLMPQEVATEHSGVVNLQMVLPRTTLDDETGGGPERNDITVIDADTGKVVLGPPKKE